MTVRLPSEEIIVAAAVMQGDVICAVPRPGRHHDVIKGLANHGTPIPIRGAQGFLTNTGRFVNRWEAMDIAKAAGQARQVDPKRPLSGELYSEDVW